MIQIYQESCDGCMLTTVLHGLLFQEYSHLVTGERNCCNFEVKMFFHSCLIYDSFTVWRCLVPLSLYKATIMVDVSVSYGSFVPDFFFFQLFPHQIICLHLTLGSSSVAPALSMSSFTTSMNFLCGLPFSLQPVSFIFNIL